MVFTILLILLIFIVLFVSIWLWFYKQETNFAQKFYNIGLKAFEHQDYEKAIKLLLKATESKTNFKEAIFKLGQSYLNNKDYEKAKETFEKVLKIAPKDFDSLYHIGLSFQAQSAYEEAKEMYNKALKENDKSPDCYFNLGVIAFRESLFEKAIEYFEKSKEINPDRSETTFCIAKCKDELCSYETQEQGQSVIDEYLKIADKKDIPPCYNINLAKAYAKTGNIEQALKHCKLALIEDDKDVESYKLLGIIQLVQKNSAAAKNTLSTALNLDVKDVEAHDILSYILCQHEDRSILHRCRQKYQEIIKNLIKHD